jgi:hypothetical protein
MKPLGYNCRHATASCACCDPSGQRIYRRNGKRRDRQKAKRAVEREVATPPSREAP